MFSNFVDGVFESELIIPDKVLEFAKKGELYDDIINQFKIRLGVDEGLLDEEIKSLLSEAKDEIIKQRLEVDKLTGKNLEVLQDCQELAATVYMHGKCDEAELSQEQKKQVFDIIGDATDRAVIDRKLFSLIKKYDKAITAFTVLSLKYPEKNSFFANQIEAIKELQGT